MGEPLNLLQISFIIPPEIVPGRAGVLVTVMLVLVNLFLNITSKSPNTDSLTAISCWMIGCILFVALALMEYAIILFSKHIISFKNPYSVKSKIFAYLDSFSLLIFMLLFIVFNVVFWNVYQKWIKILIFNNFALARIRMQGFTPTAFVKQYQNNGKFSFNIFILV